MKLVSDGINALKSSLGSRHSHVNKLVEPAHANRQADFPSSYGTCATSCLSLRRRRLSWRLQDQTSGFRLRGSVKNPLPQLISRCPRLLKERRRERAAFSLSHSEKGFTLLETLVALALLGIAITVVFQLFSANLRAISASDSYLSAVAAAEAKMKEVVDDDKLSQKSWTETTDSGYRVDISVATALTERTETLQVNIFEIDLTLYWFKGTQEKSLTLKTMKTLNKQI